MTSDGSFQTVGSARLPRPTFANVPEYGARLGDAGFWGPYVAEVLARHGLPHAWATLPARLIDQIDRFLIEPLPVGCLVHADLHQDHLFVDRTEGSDGDRDGVRLVGVIDWGDALVINPYYELPALHLGMFRGDRRLLKAFLEGYGWQLGADFARRAMSMALLHEWNVLADVREIVALDAVPSLDALAAALWELP